MNIRGNMRNEVECYNCYGKNCMCPDFDMKLPDRPRLTSASFRQRKAGGFSLIEALIVIAILGLVASVAIPTMNMIHDSADESKARRNAQSIASIGASAQIAGFEYTGTTAEDAASELVTGVYGTGRLANMEFRVSTITGEELQEALQYLDFVNSAIVYQAN